MKTVRNAGALMLGILPLLVGCAQPGWDASEEQVGVAVSAEGGEQKPGSNGFDPLIAQPCEPAIRQAMQGPLVTLDEMNQEQLNPQLDGSLKPIAGGGQCSEALAYAFKCAGDVGATLPGYTAQQIVGERFVGTATGWRTGGGLDAGQQVDVLTCMTTFLNPNEGVPICLGGANVDGDPNEDCGDFDVAEAVWLAVPSVGSAGVTHHVWPLIPETLCDPEILQKVLAERICADSQGCDLHIRNDLGTSCSLQSDGYHCLGAPAIETRLTSSGFEAMFEQCIPPQ